MKHQLNNDIINLESSGIRRINQEAANIHDVISLTIGEPMFQTTQLVIDETIQALEKNQTKYPPYEGLEALRKSILDFEKETQNIHYTMDEIIITQGASGALFAALGSILNPNDEVIVFEPAYVAYVPTITMFKGKAIKVNTAEDNFQLSYEKIKEAITEKTKAIIINSPNNPTGTIYNQQSLDALMRIMDEHHLYVISDDVYNQLIYIKEPVFLVQNQQYKEQIIYCQSMSKPYSMTGWRIGYMLAPKPIINQAKKIQQYVAAGVPPFIQEGTKVAFNENLKPIIEQYESNLNVALDILYEHNINYVQPEGAFYLFVDISKTKKKSWDFARLLLKEKRVAVVPGQVFSDETDSYVRISFSIKQEQLIEAISRFANFHNELQHQ